MANIYSDIHDMKSFFVASPVKYYIHGMEVCSHGVGACSPQDEGMQLLGQDEILNNIASQPDARIITKTRKHAY